MASDNRSSANRSTAFGLRKRGLREASPSQGLSLDELPCKTADNQAGSDPYNTSGSFDRKLNWARVGKR